MLERARKNGVYSFLDRISQVILDSKPEVEECVEIVVICQRLEVFNSPCLRLGHTPLTS